ncbi:MAG TPA: hypothetical protein VGO00_26135 [Kofleriaceae bacterium]|nr:hypothetical protein [Kofleriaceae bacterium]
MLTETAARWFLVLHTALGVAAVGASTHLVVWMWRYRRGEFSRHRAVRKFAWIAFALHGLAFVVGNAMYPTYKVEVRVAYLENATAVANAATTHANAIAKVTNEAPATPVTAEIVKRAASAARWFDVKEHWIALGLAVSGALVLILMLWDPRRDGSALVPVTLALAIVVSATLWLGAVIGVITASWKAV